MFANYDLTITLAENDNYYDIDGNIYKVNSAGEIVLIIYA